MSKVEGKNYAKPTVRPEVGEFIGFDHVLFYVSNAKMVMKEYCARFGFTPVAYKGLETGYREGYSYVCRSNSINFVFADTVLPFDSEVTQFVRKHGDGVKEVAFNVKDASGIYNKAVSRGAVSVQEPLTFSDEFGSVVIAKILGYKTDAVITLVDRSNYKNGLFLPEFKPCPYKEPFNEIMPKCGLLFIDHIVQNYATGDMVPTVEWFLKNLDWHRFWSVDDNEIQTEFSSLQSTVICDFDERVKMPINEPAKGKRVSQIQEYVDYYGGPGVQHIALRTGDIINEISNLKKRGLEFLDIPNSYYDLIETQLSHSKTKVHEDLQMLRKLKILIDFDDNGYILQIFTKMMTDRPTFFIEIIQRRNHNGFGAGNFKALFECIELDQKARNNLKNYGDKLVVDLKSKL